MSKDNLAKIHLELEHDDAVLLSELACSTATYDGEVLSEALAYDGTLTQRDIANSKLFIKALKRIGKYIDKQILLAAKGIPADRINKEDHPKRNNRSSNG